VAAAPVTEHALDTLRERADRFIAELNEEYYRHYAGLKDTLELAPIYERLKRAGARNVQVRPPAAGALADLEARMDRVLVDAPCTGSGVWRRRPDAKWRLTPQALERRRAEQAALLAAAAQYVRPGGALVYATCSHFAAEGREQVAAFLASGTPLAPVAPAELWSQALGATDRPPIFFEEGALLTPATTGTDGFFVAVLQRQG
jgi:16S rRNA (cytosine967-C5)-methyltransferase